MAKGLGRGARPRRAFEACSYGHPDAGGYWERHCETQLRSVGFVPIPDWRSCSWHAGLRLFLVVYVDDFKMSGPQDNVAKRWTLIRKHIRTDQPQAVGKYLGCEHIVSTTTLAGIPTEDLMFLVLPPASADAPSLSVRGGGPTNDVGAKMSHVKGAGVQRMEWKMTGFLQQCVDLYKEIAGEKGKRLKGADTPFLSILVDDMATIAEGPTRGELAPIASRVLMKILYAATTC